MPFQENKKLIANVGIACRMYQNALLNAYASNRTVGREKKECEILKTWRNP